MSGVCAGADTPGCQWRQVAKGFAIGAGLHPQLRTQSLFSQMFRV
jgi:hypothetical protein